MTIDSAGETMRQTPCKFQRVSRLGSVTASTERQPNFAALNRGRHLCSAGRPSRWALAHISSLLLYCQIFYDTVAETGMSDYRLLECVKWLCFKNYDYFNCLKRRWSPLPFCTKFLQYFHNTRLLSLSSFRLELHHLHLFYKCLSLA